ncbi:hypothetical protein BGZ88_009784 [Linnemannia elongata]|nr:hypothetical protein BGZ88_009784 [Linnemannia elongata]
MPRSSTPSTWFTGLSDRCKWVKVNAGTPKIWTQTLPSELRIDHKEEHITDETSQLGFDFVRNVMKGVQMPTTAAVKKKTLRNQEYRTKLCQEHLYGKKLSKQLVVERNCCQESVYLEGLCADA